MSRSRGARERVGDRAHVVRGDRGADVRPRGEQPAREALEVAVALDLGLEHRRRPAVLARLDGLVLPVGALDEPDRQRHVRSRCVALEQAVELLVGVAQVGLQDDPGARAVAELGLGEQLDHELGDQVARVHRLHVDVQVRADVLGRAQQRRAAGARRPRCRAPAPRRARAAVSAVTLTREVHARDRAVRVALEPRAAGPGLCGLRERAQRLVAAPRVAVGLGGGDGRLAEQVDRRGGAGSPQALRAPGPRPPAPRRR